MQLVSEYYGTPFNDINIALPEVFVGGLLGAMLIFLFSAWAIRAVGIAAQSVIAEVREQFRARPGIMNYTEKPDYDRCVSIVAQSALKEMVRPGLLVVLTPVITGLLFRVVGILVHDDLLGAKVVAALLMIGTITGVMMALFLNNAGGAWDNAKKYIESGGLVGHGKGSEAHKAAVTGDTVGDPFKDTAGPSLHVCIKLLATITMVVGPIFVNPMRK